MSPCPLVLKSHFLKFTLNYVIVPTVRLRFFPRLIQLLAEGVSRLLQLFDLALDWYEG